MKPQLKNRVKWFDISDKYGTNNLVAAAEHNLRNIRGDIYFDDACATKGIFSGTRQEWVDEIFTMSQNQPLQV